MNQNQADDLGALLRRTQALPLAAAAVAWADAGHRVFPCLPGGKQPLTRHGFHDATTATHQVAAWWRRWPEANIALATGESVDVLDIDERPSGSGFAALAAARRGGLLNGWVAAVRTPHTGLHLYYPAQGHASSWSVGSAHVDFRARGGYVLVPPSQLTVENGRRRYLLGAYRHAGRPIDSERLRVLLRPAAPAPSNETRERAGGVDVERIAAWLSIQREGNRNHALFWAACRLAEHGISHQQAAALLTPPAEAAGLEAAEITATVRSAYRTSRLGLAILHRSGTTVDHDAAPFR